jgi:DNA-binding NarL/FixJ family response regulator
VIDSGNIRILLLEDSPLDVFLERAALRRIFPVARLLLAERLEQALSLLRENTFDLVMTDLNLPDSFGLATLRELVPHVRGAPIVVLTGESNSPIACQLGSFGAAAHISKDDMNGPVIGQVIRELLGRGAR